MFNSKAVFRVKRKKYQPKDKEEIIDKRNRWMELMKMYLYKNKTFLSDKDRAVYTLLYRHDNEWLKMNSPKKKVGIVQELLVDWDKRDEEVLELVKVDVDALITSDDKPERITKTLVAKKINKVTLLQRNLKRLPRTEAFLNNNIESLEEFQLRRVKWAIRELAKEGEVKEWDVIIKAGLSKNFYDRYLTEICNIMYKYYHNPNNTKNGAVWIKWFYEI